MRLIPRLGAFALRGVFKELRAFRKVLETGVDSYRIANGMAPVYSEQEPVPEFKLGRDSVAAPPGALTYSLIEELCNEQRVPFDHETDLIALAKDLGWMSPEGKLQLMPLSARDIIDPEYLDAEGIDVDASR